MSKCPKCGVNSNIIPILFHWDDVMRILKDFDSEIKTVIEKYEKLKEKEKESCFSSKV